MARTLLHCHASPARNGWLRSDSEQNRVASPPWVLFLTSLHPACSRRLGRFFIVTPRLLTTPGFPPTQGKPGRALPALGFALRSGPSGLFATARTLLLKNKGHTNNSAPLSLHNFQDFLTHFFN